MKQIIKKYFYFELMQYRWGRKWFGGVYWYLFPLQLGIAPFWSDDLITSCNTQVLKIETYKK